MPTIALQINVEETSYEAPTEWRMLGAKGKADHVIKLCARHGIRPRRVLEVGAGDGSILKCLSESSFCEQLYGLEISQSGVDVIRGQSIAGLVSCQTFDGYSLPFEDGFFDVVVLSHVLEHVEYERALLRELRRVSRHQVIEIPMDCNGLKDEIYHLLGPSYGHINAHTPDSLRFLLSTENFTVMDDLLGQYSVELQEYDYFVNNNHERTTEAVETFRRRHREQEMEFDTLPRGLQEARSSFYTVLTREEGADERLARAMNGIRKCIASGQVQAARLIFNHYVPQDRVSRCALEIAQDTADVNPHIAMEFLGRIPVAAAEGAELPALRARVERAAANLPALARQPADIRAAGRGRKVKGYLKARFPRLAHIYRGLRQ